MKFGKFLDSKLALAQEYLSNKGHFQLQLEVRSIRHFFQKIFFGFSDAETYSLYHTIAKFTLPRLKRFREITCTYPAHLESLEEWHKILDKMIFAFTYSLYEDFAGAGESTELEDELVRLHPNQKDWNTLMIEGYHLFGEYQANLWW